MCVYNLDYSLVFFYKLNEHCLYASLSEDSSFHIYGLNFAKLPLFSSKQVASTDTEKKEKKETDIKRRALSLTVKFVELHKNFTNF